MHTFLYPCIGKAYKTLTLAHIQLFYVLVGKAVWQPMKEMINVTLALKGGGMGPV